MKAVTIVFFNAQCGNSVNKTEIRHCWLLRLLVVRGEKTICNMSPYLTYASSSCKMSNWRWQGEIFLLQNVTRKVSAMWPTKMCRTPFLLTAKQTFFPQRQIQTNLLHFYYIYFQKVKLTVNILLGYSCYSVLTYIWDICLDIGTHLTLI